MDGAIAGALVGFGDGSDDDVEAGADLGAPAMEDGHLIHDEEARHVAGTIPNGSVAAFLVLEHLWAIPFRDASVDAGRHRPRR